VRWPLDCRAFRKFSRGATKLLWPAFQTEVVALLPHLGDGDEISGIFKVYCYAYSVDSCCNYHCYCRPKLKVLVLLCETAIMLSLRRDLKLQLLTR
jgi:hypothetical protein